MRDSDGSARAEAPPEASPSASRQGRPTPTPRSPPSASKGPLACNPGAPPRSHLDARRAVQPRAQNPPHPRPPVGGRGLGEHWSLGAASSTFRGQRVAAAARKGQRLFRRRPHRARLSPPAALVAPDAAPLVSAPPGPATQS